jgi:hypothetical protein
MHGIGPSRYGFDLSTLNLPLKVPTQIGGKLLRFQSPLLVAILTKVPEAKFIKNLGIVEGKVLGNCDEADISWISASAHRGDLNSLLNALQRS